MEKIEFSHGLIDWYWQFGSKRTDDYAIPTSGWLRRLYEAQKQLTLINEARSNTRPAMAVWGPSQTGKSTLVSAYIDGKARYEKKEDTDGEGSGLHWPGGGRAFFMSPDVNAPLYMNRMVLNPYNQGWDGSSCLSRFVCASTKEGAAPYTVKDIHHPIELKLIPAADLLQVVARGYDTECMGPSRVGAATNWTTSEFESRLAKFRRKHSASAKGFSRAAYESLHDLCGVLADLVFAEMPRYRGLLEQGDDNWHALLASLLADPVLLSSPEVVDAFAGEVLWDGSPVLQDYYMKMRAQLRILQQAAGSRPIFASLEAAIIMLNMAACTIYFRDTAPDPDSKEGVIYPLIAKLGYRVEADRLLLGCGGAYAQRLATTPEHFAATQGLVWELVIPLNQDNLPDSPFKDFLRSADMLDFAGVGNEPKGDVSRIFVHGQAPGGEEGGGGKGLAFQPVMFFSKIIKRGKTGCIVSTYAKRMSVDGFNVFQNIDAFPAVNAHQLINGIESWWKYLVPEYYRAGTGPSPLPLNLGLMWWASRLKNGAAQPKDVYPAIVPIIKELGRIADPEVSLTFAFNYYKFPRGEINQHVTPELFERVASVPEFRKQFSNPVSQESYLEMSRDKITGGTGYFFGTIKKQLEEARARPESNRLAIVETRIGAIETGLSDLLNAPKLFPPVKVVDVRKEHLERFRAGLLASISGKPEKQLREINQALREFLDIPFQVLLNPPDDESEVDRQFIGRQYRQWIDSQLARFDQWDRTGRRSRPNFGLLGLTQREAFNETLEALRASIEHRYDDIARWLARLVAHSRSANSDLRALQLRRHLAVRMANEIVSSHTAEFAERERPEPGDEEAGFAPMGRECLTYQAFVAPFVEAQLEAFITLRLDPIKRPDQPGDKELAALCARFNLRPA